MIFLVMLIACSLLIGDAAQLDTYKHYYDSVGLNTYDKRNRDDFCEEYCHCQGPTTTGKTYVVADTHKLSQTLGKYLNPKPSKRLDETSPQEMETVYSILRRDDLSYPIRVMFGQS